ncbi:hypothetical protein L202_05291 [Cryptococcus amylolentus CBS 6039]|uniref:Uncharacterized protein n=2 Tax=Cryptococcus amylolentus TaxID=104669 RepID=A0A1E3HJX8_9TREE|nr:hypothetical protein L202_05291 [Cryptococcus amylolentus CBS 6039]ODN76647.1 hypothetical protein L202_05291 [Cryptococcus amylolentus CBS 6039]ODO04615.1 hypothetical protein I350_05221 [Cryptococcus amylolentus CBS 6273]
MPGTPSIPTHEFFPQVVARVTLLAKQVCEDKDRDWLYQGRVTVRPVTNDSAKIAVEHNGSCVMAHLSKKSSINSAALFCNSCVCLFVPAGHAKLSSRQIRLTLFFYNREELNELKDILQPYIRFATRDTLWPSQIVDRLRTLSDGPSKYHQLRDYLSLVFPSSPKKHIFILKHARVQSALPRTAPRAYDKTVTWAGGFTMGCVIIDTTRPDEPSLDIRDPNQARFGHTHKIHGSDPLHMFYYDLGCQFELAVSKGKEEVRVKVAQVVFHTIRELHQFLEMAKDIYTITKRDTPPMEFETLHLVHRPGSRTCPSPASHYNAMGGERRKLKDFMEEYRLFQED